MSPDLSPERWTPPTRRTDPAKGGNRLMRCACQRTTNADLLTDLSGVDPAIRAHWGVGEAICDACRERLLRSEVVTRADFVAALGAPSAAVERIAGKTSTTMSTDTPRAGV